MQGRKDFFAPLHLIFFRLNGRLASSRMEHGFKSSWVYSRIRRSNHEYQNE